MDLGQSAAGERSRPDWLALVADESSSVRVSLTTALRTFNKNIEIFGATTGREAYEFLLERRPNIAFINVQLPEMTGPEAIAWARLQGVQPLTVLMSQLVLPKWVDVSTELDAYEFLKKPFDMEHVVHLLRGMQMMRRPLRVLLVEESEAARGLVRKVLSNSRFKLEIDETDSGHHALKALRMERYDIALIDRGSGRDLDGLEVACKTRDVAPHTKCIMMSPGETAELTVAARYFGVVTVLKKPFYSRDVDYALHTAYKLRRPYLLNAMMGVTPAAAKQTGTR